MALWGNNDNVGAAGSVSVNYATKVVTGPAGTGSLGPLFGETGNVQEGDVISFGVKTEGGTYFGDAVVASIASTTSLSIASTAGLSGAAIAATTFSVSQSPKFLTVDSKSVKETLITHHMCMELLLLVLTMHKVAHMQLLQVGLVFRHMLTVVET